MQTSYSASVKNNENKTPRLQYNINSRCFLTSYRRKKLKAILCLKLRFCSFSVCVVCSLSEVCWKVRFEGRRELPSYSCELDWKGHEIEAHAGTDPQFHVPFSPNGSIPPMGHFRVAVCLGFEVSLGAQLL